jgi:uncharacterized membrane protein YdjX (TVP38/TMEM64 family)
VKTQIKSVILLAVILLLALWIVGARENIQLPSWLDATLRDARHFHASYPVASIALFCLAHFVWSMLSIPGSCTLLNVSSGAVFGFWTGCAVVYPVTMLSGCVGYLAASKLRGLPLMGRYEKMLGGLQAKLQEGGFLFLVGLRLSPFFPYGVLNAMLGLLRVPFGTFLASTFVGIFLDVFLLNSIGAALAAAGGGEAYDGRKMLLAFCGLLAALVLLHYLAGRMKSVKPQ